jgi:hypothetical protein
MAIEHKNITDAERHEPKGISTATVDKVYFSNGAGSGSWGLVEADKIKSTSISDGYVLVADEASGETRWSLSQQSGHGSFVICSDDTGTGVVTVDLVAQSPGSSTQSVPFTITGSDFGIIESERYDATRKQIRVKKAGSYLINFGLTTLQSATGTNPWLGNETVTVRLYKNGSAVNGFCYRFATPSTFTGTNTSMETGAVVMALENAAVDDVFDIRLWQNTAGTRRLQIYHGRFSIIPLK